MSNDDNPLWTLFDSLITNKKEKGIIKLIIDDHKPDEIIENLLGIKDEGD